MLSSPRSLLLIASKSGVFLYKICTTVRQVLRESAQGPAFPIGQHIQAKYKGYWYEAVIMDYSAVTSKFILMLCIFNLGDF